MGRILQIMRMRAGQEGELRAYIAEHWRNLHFGEAGFAAVDVFLGSGFAALLYEFSDDFKPAFERLLADRHARDFFAGLTRYVEDAAIPVPDHAARFPLAGDAFRWPDRAATATYRPNPEER